MSQLPFPFVAADFLPLQPEDSARELELRTDARYAHLYANRAEQLYAEQGESVPAVNDYQAWLAVCGRMDAESEAARVIWRAALTHRDHEIIRLRDAVEAARLEWKKLEGRPKPPQPRSARKGN